MGRKHKPVRNETFVVVIDVRPERRQPIKTMILNHPQVWKTKKVARCCECGSQLCRVRDQRICSYCGLIQ